MRSARLPLGPGVDVFGFSTGTFLVDGRAMFGGLPAAGRRDRFPLSLNCFLIRTPGTLILADTGIGTMLDKRYLAAYKFGDAVDIPDALAAFGFAPEDVGLVFNSHLHFDHCGGNMRMNADGEIVPAFPRARYVVQRGEWESALHPVARDRQSYLAPGLKALAASGRLELVEGDLEIAGGVGIFLVPGHTEFHQCLKVEAGGRGFVVPGDLVPTSAHVGLDSAMSYDLFPALTMENKRAFYGRALAGDWVLGLSHDPEIFFGRIRETESRFRFQALG